MKTTNKINDLKPLVELLELQDAANKAVSALSWRLRELEDNRMYEVNKAWHIIYNLDFGKPKN